MHRQARCDSARFCALPRSRFCFALLSPYTADGFAFSQGPCTLSSARNRNLRPNSAVTALTVLQLGCSTASSGFRLRSPDCGFGSSNRKSLTAFAAASLRSFFALELSAGLASEVALRLLPIRPAADPRRCFSDLCLSTSIFETQTRAIQDISRSRGNESTPAGKSCKSFCGDFRGYPVQNLPNLWMDLEILRLPSLLHHR
jgi:hypothetical protein